MDQVDLLIVGAGPSGMSAAIEARRHGLDVLLVDDHPMPGGHIWSVAGTAGGIREVSNVSYRERVELVEAFCGSGAIYQSNAELWRLEPGFRAFVSQNRKAKLIQARAVILATGAQERPVPFPGWTLPGVLTVGAAQILLKHAKQIPVGPLWIAGSGPLPLIYAVQLLRAGGVIAGYLDTTPSERWRAAVRHLPQATRRYGELLKGLMWMATLRRSKTRILRGVTHLEATGSDRIELLRFCTNSGRVEATPVNTLLVHEGLIPRIHPALSLSCAITWLPDAECFAPTVDSWGETSVESLFVVGDGVGVAGFRAAQLRGRLAAIRVAAKFGIATDQNTANRTVRHIIRELKRELAIRPFLNALFAPRSEIFSPSDGTTVCRCEEVTAGDVRAAGKDGILGPNQIKAATRVGMGPCQGRQCGYTVTRILCTEQGRHPTEVGFFNIRSPLRPVTLGELASFDKHDLKILR